MNIEPGTAIFSSLQGCDQVSQKINQIIGLGQDLFVSG